MVTYVSALFYGVGGIVVAGVGLLVALQEKLVYVPVLPGLSKSYPITPPRLNLFYEDVWLQSADGVSLHAWFIKMFPECRGPSILFFQENAGTMGQVMVPSQHGLTKDAQAALDHLSQRTDIDTSRIVVFGRSLGGAVGAMLTKVNPDKFIGGSGTKSLKLLNFVVRSPWNTIDAIAEVKQPILFLSGLQDERVPPFHMKMLYAKAAARNPQCTLVEFPRGMHMDTWMSGGDIYWKTNMQFLEKHSPEKKER